MVDMGLINCETRYYGKRPYNVYYLAEKGTHTLEREQEESRFIKGMLQEDGKLRSLNPYVNWPNDIGRITLNGEFSIRQLKKIVRYIDKKKF